MVIKRPNNKSGIRKRFSRSAVSYDAVASVQREVADLVVDKLLALETKEQLHVLEIGCGTGYLTEKLVKNLKIKKLSICEISQEMILATKKRLQKQPTRHNTQIKFIKEDVDTLHMDYDASKKSFDLVVSSLALQWSDDIFKTLSFLGTQSNILAFSTLLDGSFKEWQDLYINHGCRPPTFEYPQTNHFVRFFEAKGWHKYTLERKKLSLDFPSRLAFVRYLRELGASQSSQSPNILGLKFLLKDDPKITITYEVLIAVIQTTSISSKNNG